MTGRMLPLVALRPDGTEAARGPLMADVIADAVRLGGAPWHILLLRGWRIEAAVPADGEPA